MPPPPPPLPLPPPPPPPLPSPPPSLLRPCSPTTLTPAPPLPHTLRRSALGKWHLGYCREEFAPHRRGFDTFNGYMNGAEHYFTHVRDPDRVSFKNFTSGFDYYASAAASPPGSPDHGIDWAQNASGPSDNIDPEQGDCYSAHHLSAHAAAIVEAHPVDAAAPLFLYLAYQSVHSPFEAPQMYVDQYAWMNDSAHYTPVTKGRPTYGGMVAALDEGVGNVTAAFARKGGSSAFWENTILIFTTDNGGISQGNNWPLRGRKATLWEGGTRAVGFARGAGLGAVANSTSTALVHAVDWLPTLLSVADKANPGAKPATAAHRGSSNGKTLDGIDGLDVWAALASPGGSVPSPRKEMVYNIEPNGLGTKGMKCGAVRVGCHKLIKGDPGSGTYDPQPPPRPANATPTFAPISDQSYHAYAAAAALAAQAAEAAAAEDKGPWLFDLCADPLEKTNMYNTAAAAPVQATLEARLSHYHSLMVPAMYNTMPDDRRFAPQLNNNTWTWFGCEAE
jgi:hypothetical protein